MVALKPGRYRARFANGPEDIAAAQRLRHRAFRGGDGVDADQFDERCQHVLVEDSRTGSLVCCFRMLELSCGDEILESYSAQYYELSALRDFDGPLLELGRFCVDPDHAEPDIIRVAWAAMTQFVDEKQIGMLFGCSSFQGTETQEYLDAFAVLKASHLAPKRWFPRVKAPDVFLYGARLRRRPNAKRAMLKMPPLLRTYLLMGGWVSDHAVVDRELNTLHVFTGLEISAIPPERARLLKAAAS